jgi:hypothetical protein
MSFNIPGKLAYIIKFGLVTNITLAVKSLSFAFKTKKKLQKNVQ